MIRVAVTSLVLWAGASFVEAKDNYALGLSVPGMDRVSVWNMDSSPILGLEFGGSWAVFRNGHSEHRRTVSVKLTGFWLRDTDRDVAPFFFNSVSWAHHSSDRGDAQSPQGNAQAVLGLGVSWTPFKQVGFWVRKGLAAVEYADQDRVQIFQISTGRSEAMAFFTF